jgi:tetratricopeptide (TPR) repeat protein
LSDLGEMIGGEEGIKHLKEAEETLGKSLELNDEHEFRYHWATIQNLLGKVFYSRSLIVNDNKEDLLLKSIDHFRKALTVFDRSNYTRNWADTHYNIGSSLMALGIIINSEKSMGYFNEAISNFNDALSVYKGAENTETYTLILKMTSNAYSNLGIALNNLGMFDKAIEKYEKATEMDPQLADAYTNWGAALTHFRKYDEAIEKFKKATEINPQYAIAYYNWGIALNNLGMFDKSIEKFEKATEINPQIAD